MLKEGKSPISEEEEGLPNPWIVAGALTLWPIGITLLTYLMTPGYIIPYLNHPIGRLIMAGAELWVFIGFFVMRYNYKNSVRRALIFLFFPMPAMLVPLLGPATVGILYALGPIFYSK